MTGNVFIAAGLDGFIAVSKDGKRWEDQKGREGDTFKYIAFNDGKCLLGGSRGGDNIFSVSNDGRKWQQTKHVAKYKKYCRVIFSHDKKFKAIVGGDSTNSNEKAAVIESKDGLKWSGEKGIGGKRILRRIVVTKDKIVGVGDYGRKAASSDSLKWEDANGVKAVDTLIDVAYGNGVYVGGGLHGMRMYSKDGVKWSSKIEGEEGEHINSMFFDGKQFVGVGLGGTYFSQNGKSWKRVSNNEAPHIVTYGNGTYIGAKWKGRIYTSKDAIKWEEKTNLKGAITTVGFGKLG